MRARRIYFLSLLTAVAVGAGGCGGGDEGALEDLEQSAEGTEWGPDTTSVGPGPGNSMGAGSVADTANPPLDGSVRE